MDPILELHALRVAPPLKDFEEHTPFTNLKVMFRNCFVQLKMRKCTPREDQVATNTRHLRCPCPDRHRITKHTHAPIGIRSMLEKSTNIKQ